MMAHDEDAPRLMARYFKSTKTFLNGPGINS